MKKITLAFATSLLIHLCMAQDKAVLAIEPITPPQDGRDYNPYTQQVFSLFSNTLINSKRCTVTPTDNWNVPQDATGDPYVDAARTYGVTSLLKGDITLLTTYQNPVREANGSISYTYSARITVLVKVLTVETGMYLTTKTFDVRSALFQLSSTPEGALNSAMKHLGNEISQWVAETFSLTIPVIQIEPTGGDRKSGMQILVQAGSDAGLVETKKRKDRTQFKIVQYVSQTINGQSMTRTVQVGTAEVEKVNDHNFSDCLVTSGDADVARKLGEGAKLFLISLN